MYKIIYYPLLEEDILYYYVGGTWENKLFSSYLEAKKVIENNKFFISAFNNRKIVFQETKGLPPIISEVNLVRKHLLEIIEVPDV